jgi:hypothetical protein
VRAMRYDRCTTLASPGPRGRRARGRFFDPSRS